MASLKDSMCINSYNKIVYHKEIDGLELSRNDDHRGNYKLWSGENYELVKSSKNIDFVFVLTRLK